MADMNISVGGRTYRVACRDGEEPHLGAVAGLLAEEADGLRRQFGALPETRLLLMAGLMVSDRLHGALARLEGGEGQGGLLDPDDAASEIEALRAALADATDRAEAAERAAAEARDEKAGLIDPAEAEAEMDRLRAALAEATARAEAAEKAAGDAADALDEMRGGADEMRALAARAASAEAQAEALAARLRQAEGAEGEALRALEDAARRVRALAGDLQAPAA